MCICQGFGDAIWACSVVSFLSLYHTTLQWRYHTTLQWRYRTTRDTGVWHAGTLKGLSINGDSTVLPFQQTDDKDDDTGEDDDGATPPDNTTSTTAHTRNSSSATYSSSTRNDKSKTPDSSTNANAAMLTTQATHYRSPEVDAGAWMMISDSYVVYLCHPK